MTFEEAYEKAERSASIHGGSVGLIAWNQILEQLQATYAPKVKMTEEQKDDFLEFVSSAEMNFENFWFLMGSGSSLFKDIREEDLMRAWLHPELIEVEK